MVFRYESEAEGFAKEVNSVEETKEILNEILDENIEEIRVYVKRAAKGNPIKDASSDNLTHKGCCAMQHFQ